MASNKWTKWCVGLSSAALFVGLIGINATHGASSSPASTESAATSENDQLSSGQRLEHGQGYENGGSFPSQNADDFRSDSGSSSPSDDFGGIRTHAS